MKLLMKGLRVRATRAIVGRVGVRAARAIVGQVGVRAARAEMWDE